MAEYWTLNAPLLGRNTSVCPKGHASHAELNSDYKTGKLIMYCYECVADYALSPQDSIAVLRYLMSTLYKVFEGTHIDDPVSMSTMKMAGNCCASLAHAIDVMEQKASVLEAVR